MASLEHLPMWLNYNECWNSTIVSVVTIWRESCGIATAFLGNLRKDTWCCKIKYSFWPKPYTGFPEIIEWLELSPINMVGKVTFSPKSTNVQMRHWLQTSTWGFTCDSPSFCIFRMPNLLVKCATYIHFLGISWWDSRGCSFKNYRDRVFRNKTSFILHRNMVLEILGWALLAQLKGLNDSISGKYIEQG